MRPSGNMDAGFTRSAVQTLSRSHCKNIKQKISQWEGRANGETKPAKLHPKDFGVRYNYCHQESPSHKCPTGEERSQSQNGCLPRNADAKSRDQSEDESERQECKDAHPSETEPDSSWVCARVKQIERWQAVSGKGPETSLPPGNLYTSQILWKSIETLPPDKVLNLALVPCDSTEKEPDFRVLDSSYGITKSLENIYCEPEGQECGPSINPLPKPRRTFRYVSESGGVPYKERNCDQKYCENNSCAESSLASSQEPEPKKYGGKIRGRSKRKSFEFEDIQHFRNSRKIHEELGRNAGSALYYTQSEDNIYEDIIYPAKENPYEDIPVQSFPIWRSPSAWRLPPAKSAFRAPKLPPKPQLLQRKTMELKNSQAYLRSKLTKDTTLPVTLTEWKLFRAGEVAHRKKRNLPRLVLKINDTFESKRGKKRVKLQPYTGKEAPSSKGETSGNESDAEYLPKNRHKRLAQLQQSSKRNPHYQTLERDLIELQEQQLFELFVVVSLQKKPSGTSYVPKVIQQFPSKGDHGYKQSRDTEERLKVIPKFCFPDSEEWAPTSELRSETFSFVLTGEDGSRWFGYCKKLLILDEVEKRREMSPALVYPFMRSVMEAPFPAPGRTITVKSYLPGAGDGSIELCRPLDSRLEHVDFECLFTCLSVRHLIRVCASLLLERRVIFVANSLSTLSKCGHAVVATLYPFTWQHTYIPVLPASMIDIVCSPTPFLIGILSCSLPQLQDLPIEEVLIVDLCADKFLQEVSDEDEIMPPKLQAALVQILEDRDEVLAQEQQFSQGVRRVG
ncbi:DENN domain-containing protein 2C isoform X1 [Acomys russatus]|uniref:DENN domain-containing protein 2C isoform X1 n=1 Tax=Acomys russatus TaxID=60746 RepID=UPI0021E2BF68|nr:DENN domain-containing protein 2C isoform X1 [Acomys russatus]